jgi:hypothetical protein
MWILALLPAALSLNCPIYSCTIFDNTLCARKYYDNIEINASFCADGYTCFLNDMITWTTIAEIGSEFECKERPYEESYNRGQYSYDCGDRVEGRDFIDDLTRKKCIDDSDCKLDDQSTTKCQCTFNGDAYCIPAWDGSAFDGYWKDCNNEDMDYETLHYWILYKEFYSYIMDAPDCAQWLFGEFEFRNLHDGKERPGDGGMKLLSIGLASVLILII